MSMESLLLNDNNPSLPQTKKSKKKTHHQQQQQQQQRGITPHMPNISRHKSCSAIHQKYAPYTNVTADEDLFLNHYRKQFSLNSSLPPILPTLQRPHYHHQPQQLPQPPLLPLPFVSKPIFHTFPPSSLPRKKPNKTKAAKTTTTTRKPPQNSKKENKKYDKALEGSGKVVGSIPVSDRVLTDTDVNNSEVVTKEEEEEEEVPLIFSLASPPPSSLPLPKFTMRQNIKLSCHAEAAVADEAATDNLCRLLKLR